MVGFKIFPITVIATLFSLVSLAQKSIVYTTQSDMGLTMSNVGYLGNSFKGDFNLNDAPSCEYPRNSGVEHLFEGGLWIGAKVRGSEAVSTAAYDNARGYSTGGGGYEFTAEVGAGITEKSSLFNSKVYDPNAISHQDYVCDFSDKNILVPGTNIQISGHDQPLGLEIHMESYNWNYTFSNFFVILDYTIKNTGTESLSDVYIGTFTNAVVRNINTTPAGTGGGAFYDKGCNGYNDSLYMGYCYDGAGDLGFTESYFSHKFLGAESKEGFHLPSLDTAFKAHYNSWQWSNTSEPILFSPTTDKQKYGKMSAGLNWLPSWTGAYDSNNVHSGRYYSEILNTPSNRSDLVSVGPFTTLEPGEEIKIAFAIVCAKKNEDGNPNTDNNAFQQQNLISNASWAQTAYCGEDINCDGILDEGEDKNGNGILDRYILPAPPDIPTTKYVTGDNELSIYWASNSEFSIDPISQKKDFAGYNIYLSKLGFETGQKIDLDGAWEQVASYDLKGDNLFYETGLDSIRLTEPIQFEGDTNLYLYKYTIKNLVNGWQYVAAITAFDSGDETAKLESLESSRISNSTRAFTGTTPNDDLKENKPFAYPNPYYLGAAWEGYAQRQTSKRLQFANLPEECDVTIFNVAGDLIASFNHSSSYNGDIGWYQDFSDSEVTTFSGGEHSWDLISNEGQTIARGLYLFTVKDLKNNKLYKGQFTIIK